MIVVRPNQTTLVVSPPATTRVVVGAVGPQGPAGPAGAADFIDLGDTPGAIPAGQYLIGAAGGGSLEFVATIPAADVSGLATVAVSGDYGDLLNVPATFPPDAHTHIASEIVSGTLADARISQSSVVQHEASLTLTASQVSDFSTAADARIAAASVLDLGDTPAVFGSAGDLLAVNPGQTALEFVDPSTVGSTTFAALTDTPGAIADGEYLVGSGGSLVFVASIPAADVSGLAAIALSGDASDLIGTLPDARVASSNVTQHEGDLSIAETQVVDGSLLARLAADETVTGEWSFDEPVVMPAIETAGQFSLQWNTGGTTGEIIFAQSPPSVYLQSGVERIVWDAPTMGGRFQLVRPDTANVLTFTLPANDGNADQVLVTDGSGVLSWKTVGSLIRQYVMRFTFENSPASGEQRLASIPFPSGATLVGVRVIADQTGSVVFDVFKGNAATWPTRSSIVGSTTPRLTSQSIQIISNLSGWTTKTFTDDIFMARIVSGSSGLNDVILELIFTTS